MQVIRRSDGLSVQKPDGTHVIYHLFPEYEVHDNVLDPHTTQAWHHHLAIEEIIFVFAGTLEARWIEGEVRRSSMLRPGDLARVEHSVHTFVNESDDVVRFLVLRIVLDGVDKSELIKHDKRLDEVL